MAKLITFWGQAPRNTEMSWLPKARDIAIIFLALMLLSTGQSAASNGDSSATFQYRPFSEAEINAAVQKPLVLDDCIRIALSKNIDLRLAQGDLMKAEAAVSGSYGDFLPAFSIEGSKQQTEERRPFDPEEPEQSTQFDFDNRAFVGKIQQTFFSGMKLGFSADLRRDINSPDRYGEPPTRTQNRSYDVTLTQPLLRDAWFKVARSPITLARQEYQMQEKNLFDSKLQTIFAIKRAFYQVVLQRELGKVHQAALQRDSTLIGISEAKVKAMVATRRDVLSAEIRFAEDRAAFIASQTDYQRALDELKDVMGLPIEMPIELAEAELSYSPQPLDEKALVEQAIQNSPLIQGTEIAVKNSRLQLAVAKNQRLPRLDLSVQYVGQFDTNLDRTEDVNTKDLQATLSLSYSFLDRAANAKVQQMQIALSQQEDRLVDLQRKLIVRIRDVVRSAYSIGEEVKAIKRSIEAAEQKVTFATTMFNLGRASNLDITDAQEALLKAQTAYVRKVVEYHTQLALLESIIGQPAAR
jgi:HAE1 family hydrophobic/amphiphilic exporter-1